MQLAVAGRGLVWEQWDDAYVVYQPSSAETHVFNETTALILRRLEEGPLPMEELRAATESALGVAPGELAVEDVASAVGRLEELGLVERVEDARIDRCSSAT